MSKRQLKPTLAEFEMEDVIESPPPRYVVKLPGGASYMMCQPVVSLGAEFGHQCLIEKPMQLIKDLRG